MTAAPPVHPGQRLRNLLRPPVRLVQRSVLDAKRFATAAGNLPHFLVLGAQKSGTTSVYEMMIQHPQILPARIKEIGYFDRYYGRGTGWYRANFPECLDDQITGEATPDYLFLREARERIFNDLPADMRFIVLLRNPVDRALSHYFHAVQRGYETLDLANALDAEAARIEHDPARPAGAQLERRTSRSAYSYFARGLYADQLRLWFARYSREQFYVETSDRFFAEPGCVTDEICHFLGLSSFKPEAAKLRNVGTYSAQIDSKLYELLSERFRDSIDDLEDLLGRQFDWPSKRS